MQTRKKIGSWTTYLTTGLLWFAPLTTFAQNLQNFEPTVGRSGAVVSASGRTLEAGAFRPSVTFSIADEPLVSRDPAADINRVFISRQTALDLGLSWGLTNRLELGLTMPVGDVRGDYLRDAVSEGMVLGDLRLFGRYGLLKDAVSGYDLAMQLGVTAPTGDPDRLYGSRGMTVTPKVLASIKLPLVELMTNLGLRFRTQQQEFINLKIGHEAVYSSAAVLDLDWTGVQLVTEVFGSLPLLPKHSDDTSYPLEGLLGLRFTGLGARFTFGSGFGLNPDRGVPNHRIFFSVAYGPETKQQGAKKTSVTELSDDDEDTPIEEASRADEPTEDEPSEDAPSEDAPSEDEPSADEPSAHEPSAHEPSADGPREDTPKGSEPSQGATGDDTSKDAEPKRDMHVDQVAGNDAVGESDTSPGNALKVTAAKTEDMATPAPVNASKDTSTEDAVEPTDVHAQAPEAAGEKAGSADADAGHDGDDESRAETHPSSTQAPVVTTPTNAADIDATQSPSMSNEGASDADTQPSEAQSSNADDANTPAELEEASETDAAGTKQEGESTQASKGEQPQRTGQGNTTDGTDAEAPSDSGGGSAQVVAQQSSVVVDAPDSVDNKPEPAPTEPESGDVNDADGDGVQDDTDQCRNDAEDRDGFEDQDGCPDVDNDDDGVPDSDDRCPNGESGEPSQQGCHSNTVTERAQSTSDVTTAAAATTEPSAKDRASSADQRAPSQAGDEPAEPASTMISYNGAIRFRNGSNRLAYGSLGVLKAILPTLKADAQGKILVVHAYSFAMTTPKQNVRISSERGLAVKKALVGLGVSEDDIVYAGMGRGTNEQRKRAVGDGLIEFHAVDLADAPFELSQIAIEEPDGVSVVVSTSRPIEESAVDIRADGESVAMIRFDGAQVRRGWIKSKTPLIKRALLHPSVEMMPGGVIRIRWTKAMPQSVLESAQITIDGQTVRVLIPKW